MGGKESKLSGADGSSPVTEPGRLFWDVAHTLSAPSLRASLQKYTFGDIATFLHGPGAHEFPDRPLKLAVIGNSHLGKSAFLNSVITAWDGPLYQATCKEYAHIGTNEEAGTIRFDGPFSLMDRSDPRNARVVIELYDTAGFVIEKENKMYKDHRTNVAIDIALGTTKPGAQLKGRRPALVTKRVHPSWDGIDAFVILASCADEKQIKDAIKFHTSLRAENIRCHIVLTHADQKQLSDGPFAAYDSCHNYNVGDATTEERNVHFLRILTKVLFTMEKQPRVVADESLSYRMSSVAHVVSPAISWARSNAAFLVVVIVLVALLARAYLPH